LGLALVTEHVRLHGGRVWVEDRPGGQGGARFVVELPVVDVPPTTQPSPIDPVAVPT
jgi:signal transduction histidine kinase